MPTTISLRCSFILCTLNRCDLLRNAVESIYAATAGVGDWELIVVDNGSTDATRAVCEEYTAYKAFRYVCEAKTGLSHARNAGVRESTGEYVVFIDDDAKVCKDYWQVLDALTRKIDFDIAGGPYYSSDSVGYYAEKAPPAWFRPSFCSYSPFPSARYIESALLVGGNLVIKRAVLEKYGLFRTDLGMMGAWIGYGEETELQKRYLQAETDPKIYYCPDLAITHFVPSRKMTMSWRRKSLFSQGRASLMCKKNCVEQSIPNLLVYTAGHVLKGLLRFCGAHFTFPVRCAFAGRIAALSEYYRTGCLWAYYFGVALESARSGRSEPIAPLLRRVAMRLKLPRGTGPSQ